MMTSSGQLTANAESTATNDATMNREANSPSRAMEDDEEDETNTLPLFMTGLPSDFGTNRHLAAIASLLEDAEDPKKTTVSKKQKSVVKRATPTKHRRAKIEAAKAPKPESRTAPAATVGEAHLFFKLWNLKE